MESGSRLVTNLFLGALLGLQLLLPVRGFVQDKHEIRGNFSWNMYSKLYRCRVGYLWITRDGTTHVVNPKDSFASDKGPGKLYHRRTLPYLHEWLCEETRRRKGEGVLRGTVACSLNNGSDLELVRLETDLCTDERSGVIPR